MRHELVEAQVHVLRMYLEKKPSERFLDALDRLIDCTRGSFREEERLMESLTSTVDAGHRDKHNAVLAQLSLLRRCAMESDRGRLLAQLILVDRQLISHLSDAEQTPLARPREHGAERDSQAVSMAEAQARH